MKYCHFWSIVMCFEAVLVAGSGLAFEEKIKREKIEVELSPSSIRSELDLACQVYPKSSQSIFVQENHENIKSILKNEGEMVVNNEVIAVSSDTDLMNHISDKDNEIRAAANALKKAENEKKELEREYNDKKNGATKNMIAANDLKLKFTQIEVKKIDILRLKSNFQKIEYEKKELEQQAKIGSYKAKMDGVISFLIKEKDNLNGLLNSYKGDLLATIEGTGAYALRCTAMDFQIGKLVLKQKGTFTFEGSLKERSCEISGLHPVKKDDEFGFFELDCSFKEEQQILRNGLLARVSFYSGETLVEKTLPWNAVKKIGKNYSVQVKSSDSSGFKTTQVKLGRHGLYRVEVLEGLKKGEKVLADLW